MEGLNAAPMYGDKVLDVQVCSTFWRGPPKDTNLLMSIVLQF